MLTGCSGCEWWIGTNGINYLKGDCVNCDNPPLLCDDWIVCMIAQIPEAMASFLRLLPNMTPDEQDRLRFLLSAATDGPLPSKEREDRFQRRQNTQGIRTVGPLGGVGYGG